MNEQLGGKGTNVRKYNITEEALVKEPKIGVHLECIVLKASGRRS